MKYNLREGIVLFQLCGNYYLFPSQKAELPLSILISLPKEMVTLIRDNDTQNLGKAENEEIRKKLNRLIKLGFLEEV